MSEEVRETNVNEMTDDILMGDLHVEELSKKAAGNSVEGEKVMMAVEPDREKEQKEQTIQIDDNESQESLSLIIDEKSATDENEGHTENPKAVSDSAVTVEDVDMDSMGDISLKEKVKESSCEQNCDHEIELSKADPKLAKAEQLVEPKVGNTTIPSGDLTCDGIIEIEDEDGIEKEKKREEEEGKAIEEGMGIDANVDLAKGEVVKEIQSTELGNETTKAQEEEILLKETSNIATAESKPSPLAAEDDIMQEDTTDEVYYNKECINYECPHNHKQYFRVPQFALSYFKVARKKFKTQYICVECYDKVLDMYEELSGLLSAKQPILLRDIVSGRQDFVEIIDSSDEEDTAENSTVEERRDCFTKNDLDLIEKELENSIKSVLNKVEIQNQLTWSKTILTERVKRLEEETSYIDAELRSLQTRADNMHEALYQCPKIKIRQLQPLDLNSGRPFVPGDASDNMQLPPVGEVQRPPIQINETYYAVKNNAIANWLPCKVIEQVEATLGSQKHLKHYKIKFLKSQYQMLKTVSVKHLAYYDPPPVRLPIGTRVIAYFDANCLARGKEKVIVQSAFYPGVIAEPLKPNNKFRYLIFYDDGYTQYVYHKDVRLVCHVSENVWEDVHPGSRDFIQKYLTQYSINRPMVQTQKGQSMNTESNGFWLHARVVDIDCSLVQMQFEGAKNHTEWIYRGSLRLGPVFKEYQKSLQKDGTIPISRLPRRTEPFIRYTEDEEASAQQQNERAAEIRAVAKKSFGRPDFMSTGSQSQSAVPVVRHLNNSTIYVEDENKPKGKVVYYTAKRNLPPLKYKPHLCSPNCLFKITHNLSAYSPLSKPLLSGWERFIIKQKIKKVVAYRAPCGKVLRNMKELHHYLRVTENVLNVDNFDFNHETNCLAEYVIESAIVQKRDISGGQEKMAIPLVNYYDNTLPPECTYSAQRIPTEGVNLNTDIEFLVGCDCEDDCSNKAVCSCWQLTYAGAKYGNPNTPMEEVGYQYKRLLEHVPTGIYECNSRCKCKSNCLNRVVQHSLQMKLQVFKTSNRGWGLRCINDVPRGSFICVYAGHLLTEAKANEGGIDAGDEYFAELDYIEVAEQIKEGYESEVEPPEPDEEDAYLPDHDDDDEFTPGKSFSQRTKVRKPTRSSYQQQIMEDSQERQVINFNPNADMNETSVRESSIRQLFGKDEACYIMDAKTTGNLGRYFNHSCAPNLFVQNVFVDTHDLRFPWVAFFSSTHIRAGTELTWNYNYEVGVVPGKVLYCQCGAPNCRLRLL